MGPLAKVISQSKGTPTMNELIPYDIEYFLTELNTFPTDAPGACEAYARAVASLLYTKYCVLQSPSLRIMPDCLDPKYQA